MYGKSTGTSGRNIGAGKREACRTEPGFFTFTLNFVGHFARLNPAALILLLALLGGGGVFAYLKLVKNKPKTKGNDSLDDYDYGEEDSEEWETENEESDEPDADGGSTEEDDEDSVK